MSVWEQISQHLREVASGQTDAWSTLLVELIPQLEAMARRQPVGRLRNDEDAQRDIITMVISKLHRDDYRVIKKLVSHDDPPPLEAWIRVLVRRTAIDVMRGTPEFRRGDSENQPGWISLATLVTRDGAVAPSSLVVKRREVTSFMASATSAARRAIENHGDGAAACLATEWKIPAVHARRIVKRTDLYETVLEMIFAGHSQVEIAAATGRSRREIELAVGYIEEFLHARGFAA